MMKRAGLVVPKQRGTWVYYEPNPNAPQCMRDLFVLITNHFKGQFPEDLERLKEMLSMREDGMCVIGFTLKDKPKLKVHSIQKLAKQGKDKKNV